MKKFYTKRFSLICAFAASALLLGGPVHFDGQLVGDALALSGGHLGPAVIT